MEIYNRLPNPLRIRKSVDFTGAGADISYTSKKNFLVSISSSGFRYSRWTASDFRVTNNMIRIFCHASMRQL